MPTRAPATAGLALLLLAQGCAGRDADRDPTVVRAAVAGNFAAPHAELARRFRAATGTVVETSLGATGQLYAQIANGAPFDVFLAADSARPHRLEAEGLAVPGSRFTYAVGRIVLYAPRWDDLTTPDAAVRDRAYAHLAVANPDLAPYGAAARSALSRWTVWDTLAPRIVRAENVVQAFQLVESGAAEVGIVALSQVRRHAPGRYALIPDDLHDPIRQDAVLLRHGEAAPGALAYLRYLRTDEARRVIARFGYETR